MMKTIVVTNDYKAVPLKIAVVAYLEEQGYTVHDVGGADLRQRDNYVERADAGALKMKETGAEFGIFLCGSGTGISIRANKHSGIRAVPVQTAEQAEYIRYYNDANVLCLSGLNMSVVLMEKVAQRFLNTVFEESRRDRIDMLDAPAG